MNIANEYFKTLKEIEQHKIVILEKDLEYELKGYKVSLKKGTYVHSAPKKLFTKFYVLYDMFCKLEYKEEAKENVSVSEYDFRELTEKLREIFGGDLIDSDTF